MKWIRVEDALPEVPADRFDVRVLIAFSDGNIDFGTYEGKPGDRRPYGRRVRRDRCGFVAAGGDYSAEFPFPHLSRRGWGYCENDEATVIRVTHWAPVPKPPRGRKP